MIAQSNAAEAPDQSERPAAFEPELARSLALPERAPGWDAGPERRIDDGRAAKRLIAGAGIAALGLLAATALARRARSS